MSDRAENKSNFLWLINGFSLFLMLLFAYFFYNETAYGKIICLLIVVSNGIILLNYLILKKSLSVELLICLDAIAYTFVIFKIAPNDPYIPMAVCLALSLTSIVNCLFFQVNKKIGNTVLMMLILIPVFSLITSYNGKTGIDFRSASINISACLAVLFTHYNSSKAFLKNKILEEQEKEMLKKINLLEKELYKQERGFGRHELANRVMQLGTRLYKHSGDPNVYEITVSWAQEVCSDIFGDQEKEEALSKIINRVKNFSTYKEAMIAFVDPEDYFNTTVKTNPAKLEQFIRIAINNALEAYEEKKARPIIFLEFDAKRKTLTVKDEAGGFDTAKLKIGYSTKNKKIEGSGGFGLCTLMKYSEAYNVSVKIYSAAGKETRVVYDLSKIIIKKEPRHDTHDRVGRLEPVKI